MHSSMSILSTGWQQGMTLLMNYSYPDHFRWQTTLQGRARVSRFIFLSPHSVTNTFVSWGFTLTKYQNNICPFQVPISFCFRLRRNGYLWTLPMSLRNSCIKVQNTFKAFLPWCISISLKYNYSHRASKHRFCLWFSASKHALNYK